MRIDWLRGVVGFLAGIANMSPESMHSLGYRQALADMKRQIGLMQKARGD